MSQNSCSVPGLPYLHVACERLYWDVYMASLVSHRIFADALLREIRKPTHHDNRLLQGSLGKPRKGGWQETSDVCCLARAVIVEAPGGATADHLVFQAKDRRSDNGARPALPLEVLV